MMRQAGIGSVRDRMTWSKVQPDSHHTDWSLFQPVAEAVAKAGMDSVQVFHDAPRWVRPGGAQRSDRQPPLDDAAVYEFGRQYALGLGRTVRSVEYWNEQNTVFFPGYPYQYASGLKSFYAGIKSVDPGIRVLIGAAAAKPGKFFEEIYKNGASSFMDARNQHYYGVNADTDLFTATNLAVLERDGGVSKMPGWMTEMGYSLQRDTLGDMQASEREQAAHLVKTYANGFLSGYERVFFFFWRELVEGDFQTWGIVRDDFSPRPAYVALSLLTRHLAGASLVAAENHGAGRTVYFRRSSGGYVAITWGGGASLSRLGGSLVVRDIYGKLISAGSQAASGVSPLLLSEIGALPPTARLVTLPKQVLRGAAPLRLSVKVAIDGKDEGLPGRNSAALSVGEGSSLDVSGLVFATGKSAPSVECMAGPGVTVLSPGKLTLASVAANGEPFACRFKAGLLSVGESFVSVRVKDGANSDIAHVALVPDATVAAKSAVRTVVSAGVCPRWVGRNSANSSLTIQSSQGGGVCPPVSMVSRINRRGETWIFPAAQLQGNVLDGASGVRLRVGAVPGYAFPPTPMMMQLVERTGGVWLVELHPGANRKELSGLFNLAHAAPWARDDNGRLDLSNVREILIGWGGYAGEVGQQHAFVIEEFGLMSH